MRRRQLPPRRPRSAWVAGVLVLAALLGAVAWMLDGELRLEARLQPDAGAPVPAATPATPLLAPQAQLEPRASGPTLRGIVRQPNREPAQGASVVVERAITAWPEWRREPVGDATAITGTDGAFQFRIEDRRGLLVAYTHPQFAGGLAEVSPRGEVLDLRLEPGFPLDGFVTTAAGAPVANARVAIESVPGDSRRAVVRTTAANGRYSFTNLPAGPVRIVARHDSWQPASQPAVVVGNERVANLRFARATQPPLRGRVVSAATQQPLDNALVELLPLSGKLGLVDPQSVRTGADGTFVLSGLARGSMRLVVRHRDHGTSMTTQTVGVAAPDLTVELPRRCFVSGRLLAEGSAPWRGGEPLQLRDAAGQLVFTELGSDGTFRFDAPVSPGWASLRAQAPGFVFQRSHTSDLDVRIDEAMEAEFELAVTAPAVLRGRLVDTDGKPLAGASLVRTKLLAEGARTITDAAVQFDLGMFGSQVAQLFASDRDEVLATTAADGTFVIHGVEPGPLLLRTVAPGHGSRLLRDGVDEVGDDKDLGTITLPIGRRMQGRVRRGGRPFAGATVTVVGAETQASAITDADGLWRVDDLVPGDYRVRARLASQPTGSRVRTERVPARGPTPNVVIELDAGRRVTGEVLGSDGVPVPGALVSAAGASTVSDANGDFVLELPDRATELMVALPDRSFATTEPVPPGDQRLTVRLDTPPTGTIVATVTGLPGKKRLTSAVLRWSRADADAEVRSRWLELPDGELRWGLCPVGRVRVELWCEGHAPFVRDVDVTANEPFQLGEVVLEPACRLTGVVRDATGAPVAGAMVAVGDEGDFELYEPELRTADDGTFVVSGISSRSSRVVVRAAGYATRVVDVQLPGDVLAAAPLPITLERGATIEVAVGEALAGEAATVELRRDGRLLATADVGDDGKATFANRAPGTYSVQLATATGAGREVVVTAAQTAVRVQLP